MKFTDEQIEINPHHFVSWDDVQHLRLLNNKLVLVLKDHSTIELPPLHPGTVDEVFRSYERHLRTKI